VADYTEANLMAFANLESYRETLQARNAIGDQRIPLRQPMSIDSLNATAQNAAPMKTPRFLLRGFKRPHDVASVALGKLERQVLEEAWRRRGETSVRDVFLAFDESVAYTTLMTTLDRLYKKQLLSRRKDGRAFLYSPLVTPDELQQGITEDVIDGLLGGLPSVEPVLACIVDAVSERDLESLDELDRLIKKKRRELKQKD
jgi:predicted transcriptional regulator